MEKKKTFVFGFSKKQIHCYLTSHITLQILKSILVPIDVIFIWRQWFRVFVNVRRGNCEKKNRKNFAISHYVRRCAVWILCHILHFIIKIWSAILVFIPFYEEFISRWWNLIYFIIPFNIYVKYVVKILGFAEFTEFAEIAEGIFYVKYVLKLPKCAEFAEFADFAEIAEGILYDRSVRNSRNSRNSRILRRSRKGYSI